MLQPRHYTVDPYFLKPAFAPAVLSLDHLDAIRLAEIDKIVPFLPAGGRVLDLGAGTGKQALELKRRGFDVTAIEIACSNYSMHRVFPITDYDGRTIPLPDASIDVVFSSNVLEHVSDLSHMHAEIRRVLAPGGTCLHVLPTHTWRLWTTLGSTSRRSRFPLPRCRICFRKRPRPPSNCGDCARLGTGPLDTRSDFASPGGTANAATSSRNYGCSILAGGGGISATTALRSSVTSPWACSIPARCCSDCASGWPSVGAWRACSVAPATCSGLLRRR